MDYFPDSLRKEASTLFNKAGKIINISELLPENNLGVHSLWKERILI
jgi:hypothetical protein